MELAQIIKIARGDEPADTLLKNCQVINVFTGEIIETWENPWTGPRSWRSSGHS